jgi:hypothetical protein
MNKELKCKKNCYYLNIFQELNNIELKCKKNNNKDINEVKREECFYVKENLIKLNIKTQLNGIMYDLLENLPHDYYGKIEINIENCNVVNYKKSQTFRVKKMYGN